MASLSADPPDGIDGSSYDLTSASTYTKGLPSQALGFAMLAIAFFVGLGIFRTVQGPLMNVPVVGSLLSSGSGGSGGGAWEGV